VMLLWFGVIEHVLVRCPVFFVCSNLNSSQSPARPARADAQAGRV
jgi:hypothetical protein